MRHQLPPHLQTRLQWRSILSTARARTQRRRSKRPFYKLFTFAYKTDTILMVVGSISGVGSGICLPLMTVCMGFQNVNEARLKELGDKHRPAVMILIEERSKGLYALKNSKGLASKLYTFKNNTAPLIVQPRKSKVADEQSNGDTEHLESGSTTPDENPVSLADRSWFRYARAVDLVEDGAMQIA